MNLSFGLRRKLRKEPDTNVGDQNRVPSSHGSSSQGFILVGTTLAGSRFRPFLVPNDRHDSKKIVIVIELVERHSALYEVGFSLPWKAQEAAHRALIQPSWRSSEGATSCLLGKSYRPPSIRRPRRELEQRILADLKESLSRGYSAPRCIMPSFS